LFCNHNVGAELIAVVKKRGQEAMGDRLSSVADQSDPYIESAVVAFEGGDSPSAVSLLQRASTMGSLKAFTELALILDPWQNHQLMPIAQYVDNSFREQRGLSDECAATRKYPAYRSRMLKISESIDVGHREMSIEDVLRKRREHAGTVIFGSNITMWQVVEKLALTVDRSDAALGTTSQFVHSLQVYEAMLANNKTEEWYLLLGILHDVGKTLSLTGEDDLYVDGSNLILSCPAEHAGLDACVVTYSHDEFGYQKFLESCPGVDLPEEFLYGVRYHSLHSVDPRWLSEKDVQNFAWLFDDFTVYDHGTKNGLNTPPLEVMFSARRLVDKWFPDPIVWMSFSPPSLKSQTSLVPQIEGISDAVDEATPEEEARSIGEFSEVEVVPPGKPHGVVFFGPASYGGNDFWLKQKIRDLQRTVETEVVSTGVLTARKELAVLRGQETEMNKQKSDRASLSEEERRCMERVKKDILASYDEFFDGLERSFMRSQRNENKRLLSQVQQLKADNASLQLMVVSGANEGLGKGLPCSSLMLSQTVAFSWWGITVGARLGVTSPSAGLLASALLNTLQSDTYGGYVGARVKSVPGLSKEERGLFARKKFAKGDVVMRIPRTAWYSQD
ncbi:hypothetical protein FOZ63_016485, partial [Perkinsus olseni]